ncbi:heterokaryon incompatibility protein-domain-containing protein [Dichotomopilus funicola]|uniref:Heterokaryon incompatibility protein-domain-containing protein n=1 Tax=Dichotomopilus funicola TaxID=1934379 RepID=A0AAN6UVI2_9PEZI|nr:heterokaryon incompatibility protein-domain-containing protein [Dichotomopilus funicola]
MDLTPGCGSPPGAVSRNARVAHQEPSSDQDPKHGVCPGCGNLNADYFEPPEDERLVTNAPAGATLRVPVVELRNASAHCLACRAIIGLLEDNIEDFDDEELVVIKAYERKLVFELNQYGRPDGRFELYRHSEGLIKTASLKAKVAKELWPAVGTARTLGPSFSISDACCLIAPWMDECKSFHCECTRDEDENPPLPTRLLAVGDENGTAPYLYETQANEIGQYAALSHCWGPPEHLPPRTTRENLGLRRLSIPIEELPPTFSEAVQLCRGLGIPYLWIDSLCIIQDDAADWEREAARMQQVYKNAVLTISADGAVNSRVGLFKPVRDRRLPRSVTTCCPVVAVAESEGAATTERSEPERLCGRRTDLYVGLEHEWILSRRIAHFTTGELLWDCLGAEGCECQTQLTSRTSTSDIRRQALPEGHGYWGTIDNAEYWGTMTSRSLWCSKILCWRKAPQ